MEDQIKQKRKETEIKMKKEEWDSHLLGDNCMYQLSNQEHATRAEIRAQYKEYLQHLARERKERRDYKVQTDVAKTEQTQHPFQRKQEEVRCETNKATVMSRKDQSAANRGKELKQEKRDDSHGKGSGAFVETVISLSDSSIKISCSRDDQTIRSSVTAAINDDESVIAARAALEDARLRLKLGEAVAVVARVKPQATKDVPVCADDKSTLSAITTAINEDESVKAARAALEEARSRLELLGFLSDKEKTLSLFKARTKLLGGGTGSTMAGSDGDTASFLNETIPPLEYACRDVKEQSPPSVITFDTSPLAGGASPRDDSKLCLGRVGHNKPNQTAADPAAQNTNRSSSPFELEAPVQHRKAPSNELSYLDWISRPMNPDTPDRYDNIAASTNVDADSHIMDSRSVVSTSAYNSAVCQVLNRNYCYDDEENQRIGAIFYSQTLQPVIDVAHDTSGGQALSLPAGQENDAVLREKYMGTSPPTMQQSEYRISSLPLKAIVPMISVSNGTQDEWSVPA